MILFLNLSILWILVRHSLFKQRTVLCNCLKVRRWHAGLLDQWSQELSMRQPATIWNLRLLLCAWGTGGAKLRLSSRWMKGTPVSPSGAGGPSPHSLTGLAPRLSLLSVWSQKFIPHLHICHARLSSRLRHEKGERWQRGGASPGAVDARVQQPRPNTLSTGYTQWAEPEQPPTLLPRVPASLVNFLMTKS